MRDRVLFAVACVLAIGAGLWLGVFRSSSETGTDEYSVVEDEGSEEIGRAPGLLGAGDGRVHVPREIRGRGSLQGTVRRKGDPIPADVELRHVAQMDPTKPYLGGMTQMMIERMLDAGISSKAVIARSSAGDDGTFHFVGLAPGLYEVRASAENGAVGFASAMLPAEGARVEASIEVASGEEQLEGRVVYANGTAFRGLVVAATGEGFGVMMGGSGNIMPTATDEEGRFVLGGLAPGTVRVSAILPGVLRVMAAPITLPHAGEYVLTIDAEGVEVKGRVISAATQEPVAGATVFGGGGQPETRFTIRTTTSAEDGTFALAIPAGRGGGMFVKAAGYAPAMVNFRGASTDDVTVSLQKLAGVSGIVKSKDGGTPVAGVGIYAVPASRRGGDGAFPSGTISDASGRYALTDVAPGSVKLFAVGGGWVTEGVKGLGDGYSPFTVSVEPGGSAELDMEVVPGGKASGVVRTSTGDVVGGAVVTPTAGTEGMMLAAMMGGLGGAFGATVSDAEGRYTVDSLFPGQNYVLQAKAPGLPDAKSKGFQAEGGKTHEEDLIFSAPRWLNLMVVAADGGAPIVGARASMMPAGTNRVRVEEFFGTSSWVTAADGRVKVGPLPPDEARIAVVADGFIQTDKTIDAAGTGDVDVTVEMRKGLVIAGRVVVPDGFPVQGVRIRISTDHSFGGQREHYHQRVGVAEDGTFRVGNIKEQGAYEVRATAEWERKRYEARRVVEAGTEDVTLRLKRDAATEAKLLTVKVFGADGKPLSAARIQLSQFRTGGGSSSSRRSVSQGKTEFEVEHPDAEIWVEVWEAFGAGSGATIQGPFSADSKEIEVRLAAPQSILGSVVGPAGTGVRGVRVMAKPLHPSERQTHGRDHGAGFSDAQGNFAVKGLGDLEYELHFDTPPEFAPAAMQKVRGGAKNVRVTLRQGLQATLTLLDYAGKPVGGASAYATPLRKKEDGGLERMRTSSRGSYQSDGDGVIRLRGLDPDATFRLNVTPPQGRSDLRAHSIESWTPGDTTIKLERAYTIAGVVKDTRGKPTTDCYVQHRRVGDDRWMGHEKAGEDGEFEIKGLTEGRYELRARVLGMRSGGGQEEFTAARAGASGVVLSVDPGESLTVQVADWERWRGQSGRLGRVQASLQAEGPNRTHMSGRLDLKGQVRFRGLVPGTTYTVWIGGLPDSHYVLKSGLQPGDGAVTVEAQEGGRIRGHVVMPSGVKVPWMHASAGSTRGMSVSTVVDPATGRFELGGLPDGEWSVHVNAHKDGKSYVATAKARPGAEVELELKPRP